MLRNKTKKHITAGCAVLMASTGAAYSQEAFKFTPPDLSELEPCVLEANGDLTVAAQCYRGHQTICFDSWFIQYKKCMPHEQNFWKELLGAELGRQRSEEAPSFTRLETSVEAVCAHQNENYTNVCKTRYLRDYAVLFQIRRIWAEDNSSL